jgi:hypothetical protein
MKKLKLFSFLIFIILSKNALCFSTTSIADQLESQRQRFSKDEKIDLNQLSLEIQSTAKDTLALDQSGNDVDALSRLLTLQKYVPLEQFPDYNVQVLCANIYEKLNRKQQASDCRDRAHAMAEILQKRSGSGMTPDDPVRVVMVGEINEWVNLHSANISNVRGYQYHDTPLQQITYTGPSTGGQPAIAYFAINSRATASINRSAPSLFDPLPLNGEYALAYKQAHEQRIQFLADHSFNYPALIQLCRDSGKQAMQLAQQGDYKGALAKIREVEKIRPIRNIPMFSIISNYSYLLGKSGNADAQADLRLYLFGITQDIAHSGDGLSPESALHVVDTGEEYSWLAAKKLRLTRQQLITKGDSRYDALDTVDGNGKAQTFYFDVTQIFSRENPLSN